MFEMKNESDETATTKNKKKKKKKKKNEDFLKELDKDRTEKSCEYAVLVSLQYKQELALVKAQNVDVTNFEDHLETFKTGFARNYDLHVRQFGEAIEEIDKVIARLQKVKDALQGSERNLRLANDKA
jgi:hypothetical protein